MPVKGEYHDKFLTAQAATHGRMDRDVQKSLFDRLVWIDALHRMALCDTAPLLLRAHDGETDAWLPLMQQNSSHHATLANWYDFTWKPIFGGVYDEVTRRALLRQLAATARQHSRRLTLSPLPDEDNSAGELATAFEQAGCLRLGLAYIDGHPVAAQYWTVENGAALIHKLAHDERHLSSSPGT